MTLFVPSDPLLAVNHLSVSFTDARGELDALEDVSLTVGRQDFVCVLGPSGCGKSTLLRTIAGLVPATSGNILMAELEHTAKVAMVFQQANLMPWRTVRANISLPLELTGVSPEEIQARTDALIDMIGLHGFEDTYPHHLSGGMAQRVALARALIQDPDILLLDEPFGSLDALTRDRMGDELLRLWQANRTAVLMVTHSISEALLLADRVVVLTPRPGRITLSLDVPFARPREEAVRYSMQFTSLAHTLREALMES